ncbi:uncharacterized protein LOC110433410 isoform X3 [Sorghum bicolor]|uniref:uncharacterized protein LOC110433410 isoform X2 n=1 Tax=Sorghum bicolor TaxID=4558 RepID=UPI000B426938|nr:uncharacterized protein LOC110433410 isoform X2 [Sorghum bicolor]XP_021311145.1 uncharacterized protein LOC110433410 isoform X3 [Sorghum bicolor]|eukprot:XP_021311144.1 uncharacterized protein LOC110433410 isoform X2 [Sorghum bicolor]
MQMVVMDSSGPLVPSSIGSTTNKHHAVDDIVQPSACSLVISYDITNVRTIKVATGFAIPGREFHGSPIPNDYARVEVLTVVEGHEDDLLDIPTTEGIEKLGQAINNFILWPRRDIRLDNPVPPIPTSILDERGFSHACSSPPLQNHPSSIDAAILTPNPSFIKDIPSQNTLPAPEPNQPQSFSLNLTSDPLSGPLTPLPTENSALPSRKDASSVPMGAEGKVASVPSMVLDCSDKQSPLIMKKWLNGATRRPVIEQAASTSKKTKQKPTKNDYENFPKKYVPGRPLLQLNDLNCASHWMKRLHGWYMRASSVEINTFNVVVPPALTFVAYPFKIPLDFEDIWYMFRLDKLELQLMRMWCLMQITDQEMKFTENPFLHRGKKVGYLDPFRISEVAHTAVMGPENDLFVGKTEVEISQIRVEEQEKQEHAVIAYISNNFLEFQDRRVVCAPYFLSKQTHWVCMHIYLYDARVLVLDSADFPEKSFEKISYILNEAYKSYKSNGGPHDPQKTNKPLHMRYGYQCHKQSPGSMHCGYYVCEFLRHDGRYTGKKVYKCNDSMGNHLSLEELIKICDEMCRFIMKEVLHKDGKYFDTHDNLANPEYQDLIEHEDS